MHLSPARFVISMFGGVRATARAVGRTPSAVSKWKKRPGNPEDRGCSGYIPRKLQPVILEEARKRGLDIQAQDLIVGRVVQVPEASAPVRRRPELDRAGGE